MHVEQVEINQSLLHFARENTSNCSFKELGVFLLQEEVELMAEELREMLFLLIFSHAIPLEDEVKLCKLLE